MCPGLGLPAPAATRTSELRFTRQVDLAGSGLRIKLMPDVRESPAASIQTYTYDRTRNGRRERVEMYSVLDLWRRAHHAGAWTDPAGNTVSLANIGYPMPVGTGFPHLTREDYDKKAAEAATRTPTWTPQTLAEWVSDYVGVENGTLQPITKRPFALRELLVFSYPGKPANLLAYVFCLNRSAVGQQSAPTGWFLVLFGLNPDVDANKAADAILNQFFGGLTSTTVTAPDTAGPSSKFQSTSTRPSTNAVTAEYLASRAQVTASIRNMKDWWYAETDNYILLSDLSSNHRVAVKDLQTRLEQIHDLYARLIPPRKPITAVSVIRMFAAPEAYVDYVGPDFRWSGGIWIPSRKELVIRPMTQGSNQQQRELLFKVAFHEAFHQYLFYALDQAAVDPWFNEGHASLFEGATLSNTKATIGEDPAKAKVLMETLSERALNLRGLLRMTYASFYSGEQARVRNYATAWGLVYYLRKATTMDEYKADADICDRYLDTLDPTRRPGRNAFFLTDTELARLETNFVKFWTSPNDRAKAGRYRLFE